MKDESLCVPIGVYVSLANQPKYVSFIYGVQNQYLESPEYNQNWPNRVISAWAGFLESTRVKTWFNRPGGIYREHTYQAKNPTVFMLVNLGYGWNRWTEGNIHQKWNPLGTVLISINHLGGGRG